MADDYDLIYALNRANYSLLEPLPFGRGTYFRPTVMLTLMLELKAGGGPALHHAVNLAIHLLNGVLLYSILKRVGASQGVPLALTFLFVSHRASVPNIYWISPRAELLAAFGVLSAILTMLYAGRRFSTIALLSATVLALVSKESAIVLPAILAIIWWSTASGDSEEAVERRRVMGRHVLLATGICLAYGVYLAARFYWRGGGPPLASVTEMARGIARGLVLMVLPIRESALQVLSRNVQLWAASIGLGAAVIGALCIAKLKLRVAMILIGLPIAAYMPLVLIQGGGGARVLYLPVALACAGLAVTAPSSPRLAGASIFLGVLMSGASVTIGSDWLTNWRLAQSCCRDFRRIARTAPNTPVVLLTSPKQVGDAPVLSNDARAFLFHCLYGKPGYLSNLETVAEVAHGRAGEFYQVERSSVNGGRTVAYRIRPEDGWFGIPAARGTVLNPGTEVDTSLGALRVIESIPGAGVCAAFEIDLKEASPGTGRIIVEFTGTGFRPFPSD